MPALRAEAWKTTDMTELTNVGLKEPPSLLVFRSGTVNGNVSEASAAVVSLDLPFVGP